MPLTQNINRCRSLLLVFQPINSDRNIYTEITRLMWEVCYLISSVSEQGKNFSLLIEKYILLLEESECSVLSYGSADQCEIPFVMTVMANPKPLMLTVFDHQGVSSLLSYKCIIFKIISKVITCQSCETCESSKCLTRWVDKRGSPRLLSFFVKHDSFAFKASIRLTF